MVRSKEERLEARVSVAENEIIAEAARMRGVSKGAFVVASAVAEAKRLFREQEVTALSAEHAAAFAAWLDRSAAVIAEMQPLVDAPELPHR